MVHQMLFANWDMKPLQWGAASILLLIVLCVEPSIVFAAQPEKTADVTALSTTKSAEAYEDARRAIQEHTAALIEQKNGVTAPDGTYEKIQTTRSATVSSLSPEAPFLPKRDVLLQAPKLKPKKKQDIQVQEAASLAPTTTAAPSQNTENGVVRAQPFAQPLSEQKTLPVLPPVPTKSVDSSRSVMAVTETASKTSITASFFSGGTMPLDVGNDAAHKPDMIEALSLADAVTLALKNNHEVQSFEARKDSAFWDHAGAYAQYMPSIEFTIAQGAEKSSPGSYNDSSGSRVKETLHNRRDRSLSVRQPLIDLAVVAEILKTGKALSLTDIEKRDMQETTAFGTVSAFLRLIQSRQAIALADEYKGFLENLKQRMQARFEGGGATKADLNRIQSRLSIAEAGRLEALAEYGSNLSEFRRLTKVVPSQFRVPQTLIPVTPPTVREAMDVALKTNPSYQASLKKVDIAEGDRNKSASIALPKLAVEYSNSYNYNAGGAAHGNPIDGVYPNQEDSRIMVVASWSLPGASPLTGAMSGSAKMREMNYKAMDVRARLEQGLSTAYDGLKAARMRKSVLQDTYGTDQSVVEDLEAQFIQGERSLFEILDSQDRLYNTKIELMRAHVSEALLAYQIRMQMGEIAQAVLMQKVKK